MAERRVISYLINTLLSKYFEQVDTEQIDNANILSHFVGGSDGISVKLQNCKIKSDALLTITGDKNLPIEIVYGKLLKFEAKISSLFEAKAKIVLDGLHLLLKSVNLTNLTDTPQKVQELQIQAQRKIDQIKENLLKNLEKRIERVYQKKRTREGLFFKSNRNYNHKHYQKCSSRN